mmetsp:Transcript_13742/g.19578  ORF Transcript_13742/g.19578 Transcript_13742/m.19578 type:complete len:236 (+) Transcript_13742:178-885(+)
MNNVLFHQFFQAQQVTFLSSIVQPTTAPRQRAVMVVDVLEKLTGFLGPEVSEADFLVFHVMATLHIFQDHTPTCAAKGLDCIELILLHSLCVLVFDDGYAFPCMDRIVCNGVPVQVADSFDRVRFAFEFNFVRLHHFLNLFANIAKAHIDSGSFNASIRRVFDSFEELVVFWVERLSPSTVHNLAIDLDPKINLHNIVVLQYRFVPVIGSVVRCTVVQRNTSWKSPRSFQAIRWQ